MLVAITVSSLGLAAAPASVADVAAATGPCGSGGAATPLRCEYAAIGTDSFTVPAHVSQVTFDVYGGQGGGYYNFGSDPTAMGGRGGRATATLAATAGQVFQVDVAGRGGMGTLPANGQPNRGGGGAGAPGAGGANGDSSGGRGGEGGLGFGNYGGGGGGGASDIRRGDCATTLQCGLAERVVVAGGGGGSSSSDVDIFASVKPDAIGGAGGGGVGDDGNNGHDGYGLLAGGQGGRGFGGTAYITGVGGSSGSGGGGGTAGAPGSPTFITSTATGGAGGMGGNPAVWSDGISWFGEPGSGGGGGGGGFHGGGGGGGGGGSGVTSSYGGGGSGAGGSGYITSEAVAGSMTNAVQEGNGKVVVTWKVDPIISVPHSNAVRVGQNLTASISLTYAYNPAGTVTFKVFGPEDASCASPLATLSGTVSGGAATSAAYVPTSAGTYTWTASYGGDDNNSAAGPTGCGAVGSAVEVKRAVPSIVSASGPAWPTTHASFWDNATLSGGYEPTGSVTFALYDNGTCSGEPVVTAGPEELNEYGKAGVVMIPPAAGTFYWVATYSGDANNESVASGCGADQVVVHEQVAPTFTFDLSSVSKTYGDAAFSVAGIPYVTTNSTGALNFALGSGSVGCAVTAQGTVTITAAATGDAKCVIKASIAADEHYLAAGPISQGFNIAKPTPAFTNVVVDSATFDGEQHGATADVSGIGGEDLGDASVSYELRTGSAPDYVYGAPTATAPAKAGTYRITFAYAGSATYASASDDSHLLTIGKLDQTITFPTIPDKTYGDAPFTPAASADSGLSVVISGVSGQCGLSGTTVHIMGAGSCTVLATQPGDANHNPARSVSQTFAIAKADATISVTGYSVSYDGATHTATGTAAGVLGQPLGGLDVSPTTHTNAGTYTDGWTFTDTSGNYNNASGTVGDSIARATLTITPDSGQKMAYGGTPPASLNYALSGFVNGETESALRAAGGLSGKASCTAGVSQTSPAGTYPITCTKGSLAATNYTFEKSTQTVTFAVIAATLTVTADDRSVQYSDPVTLGYTITGFVNGETLSTSDVTGTPSLGMTATVSGGDVTSGPGTYTITAAKGSLASENYEFTFGNGTLTVGQEDARSTYTGNGLFWGTSASSTSASVNLTATIRDITALSGDPAYDSHAGTISNATVKFVNRDTKATLCTASVALVSSSDSKVGTASCSTSLGISSSGATQYTIGIVVGGRYIDDASSEDTVVDVAAPIGSYFITGGGFLTESSSAGQYAADAGTKANFGFNVKSNKGASNLQGNVNVIFRRDGHTYQVKGNSLTSLGETPSPCTKPTSTSPCTANFVSKANLQDITNPNAPISLGGNLTFQMSMTDYGSPTKDSIGITLYNGSTLLFSSSWNGTRTTEQTLGGGNLAVR